MILVSVLWAGLDALTVRNCEGSVEYTPVGKATGGQPLIDETGEEH